MLSLSFIREHPDAVREGARRKWEPAPVDEILALDRQRREMVAKLEQLKAEQNRRSAALAKSRDEAVVEELREMRDEIKRLEDEVGPLEARLNALLLEVPNPPHESVPEGRDATGNVTVREWAPERRREFSFKPRPHYELGERLDILDFERAVERARSRRDFRLDA
jgi:seryl-tRNA synthetase